MKLEVVIVCINYGDFLSHTLSYNKSLFDKIVVVTDTKDLHTKNICEFWNIECVQTDKVYRDDDKIPNKGIAINEGLKKLDQDGWVLHMDADIFLLPLTRTILEKLEIKTLKKDCLYSIDRLMCNSYEEWYSFMHPDIRAVHEGWIYLHVDRFPLGTRLVHYHDTGYWPIGYFQLWHPSTVYIYDYPTDVSGFDRTDVVHLKRWEQDKRLLIPDLVCIHLANQNHAQGQNWLGRKTAPFGPKKNKDNIFQYIIKKLGFKK